MNLPNTGKQETYNREFDKDIKLLALGAGETIFQAEKNADNTIKV